MESTIAEIRRLLTQLEVEAVDAPDASREVIGGLEVPDIIKDVVDLLFPELKPYEAALYLYLLRHSISENGSVHLRVSRRGLRSGVVKSAYADKPSSGSEGASYRTIQTTLGALEAAGALRQEGEPNREGTLYRLMLPEEIELCRTRRQSLAAQGSALAAPAAEADYYNVRANRVAVYERDGYQCGYCDKQLTRFTATLDHITAIKEGGDNSFENLLTSCLQCNSRKTSEPLGDFLAEQDQT
jgi:hypothetical protein